MSNQPGQTDGNRSNEAAYSIETDDLCLTFDDGTEALDGLSLSVPKGEFFGFLGANGAGKTTTIKVLATLLRPTSGDVRVNGFDVRNEQTKVRSSIGYMPQEVSVDDELTVRENIEFACEAYGISKADRSERVEELLDLVDVANVAEQRAKELSGGTKKRLDVATALVHDPPLIFLDEPTTGLDPTARNKLWNYFERINENGTTIFLTTQYLAEADELCDRIAVLLDGRVVESGDPAALKRRIGGDILTVEIADGDLERVASIARKADVFEGDPTVSTTDTGIAVTAADTRENGLDLLVALRDAGVTVTGFETRSPTLDDVFIEITEDSTEGLSDSEPVAEEI